MIILIEMSSYRVDKISEDGPRSYDDSEINLFLSWSDINLPSRKLVFENITRYFRE